MSIDSGVEKRISPHVVRLSLAINMCVRKTFPFYYLRWADLEKEYIKVVKGDLQVCLIHNFVFIRNIFKLTKLMSCFQ